MADLNFPNAVSDVRDLYGRQAELEKICQTLLLRQRVPIFVVGERRIGKTSLQNVAVKQVLAGEPSRFRDFNIEPRGIATYSQFTLAILRQLSTALNGTTGPLPHAIDTIDDFELALRDFLMRMGREIIICIDEFDVIVHRMEQDQHDTLMGLLYRLIERTNLPVYFFFTVTSIPQEMEDTFSSTLVSISQIIELKPLPMEEMSRLACDLTQGRFSWNSTALEELYRLGGGHPNFTKLLISCLTGSAFVTQPVTVELLAQAAQKAIRHPQADHVLVNLYKMHLSKDEKALLLFLAQREGPVSRNELAKAGWNWVVTARRLEDRNYLKLDPARQEYDFSFAFLAEWLRCWNEFELQCDEHPQLRQVLLRPEIEVDDQSRVVRVKGKEVSLSPQELKIMRCLAAKADLLVTREELIDATWDTHNGVTEQSIDQAISRLRRKLGDQGQNIETRTGHGFVLHHSVLLNAGKSPG